jgi:hypothetical protein
MNLRTEFRLLRYMTVGSNLHQTLQFGCPVVIVSCVGYQFVRKDLAGVKITHYIYIYIYIALVG